MEMENCGIDFIRCSISEHLKKKLQKNLNNNLPCLFYFFSHKINLGVLTLTSVIVPTALHYKYAWQATPSIMAPDHVVSCGDTPQVDDADYMEWGYIKPWNRYSPYIVGVLLGYLLHVTKRKQFKLSKVLSIISKSK